MSEEILDDLKQYLFNEEDIPDDKVLFVCVKRAIKSFIAKRNYPKYFDKEMIDADMRKYYACIFDLALYWVSKMGAEYQTEHIENQVHRYWQTDNDIYFQHGVVSFITAIR